MGKVANDPVDFAACLFDHLGARLRREVDALGDDERNVGDPDETQDLLEIGRLKVTVILLAVAVVAAARDHDDRAFARIEKSDRSIGRIPKRAAGLADTIEPGLQLRRDGVIVHRRTDDDHVGRLQLGDQRVGERPLAELQLGEVLVLLVPDDINGLGAGMRRRMERDVAPCDRCIRVVFEETRHGPRGEFARDGSSHQRAGVRCGVCS